MKIQIYTMQTVEEAQAVVVLGVNHVGITPSNLGLPGEVGYETARAIVEGVGKFRGDLCRKCLLLCYNSVWAKIMTTISRTKI